MSRRELFAWFFSLAVALLPRRIPQSKEKHFLLYGGKQYFGRAIRIEERREFEFGHGGSIRVHVYQVREGIE